MSKKLTNDEVIERLSKKNIELLSEYKGLKSPVTCKCHCGIIFTINAHTIIHRSASCGCGMYQYNKGNSSYKWKGCGELSASKWSGIKGNAKNRKLDFKVNIEYVWDIFLKQNRKCAYTNLELSFNKCVGDSTGTASLDRIDSTKGYIEGNIQWVHKDVNSKLKRDITEECLLYYSKLVMENCNESKKCEDRQSPADASGLRSRCPV